MKTELNEVSSSVTLWKSSTSEVYFLPVVSIYFPVGEDVTVPFLSDPCEEVGRTTNYYFSITKRIRFGHHTNAFFYSDLFGIYEKLSNDTSNRSVHLIFQFWPIKYVLSSKSIFFTGAINKPRSSVSCLWVQPNEAVWHMHFKSVCCEKKSQNNFSPNNIFPSFIICDGPMPVVCPLLSILPNLVFPTKIFIVIIINVLLYEM